MSNFMKACAVGVEVYYMDGQTDRHDEANSCPFAILQMCLITTNPAQMKQILLNKESITKQPKKEMSQR
jgi:hypothetical protein